MAYFEASYYTTYFDVEAAVAAAVQRRYGWDDGPSKEEWEDYLRRLNEAQREQMAEQVASRQNLREMILAQLNPREKRIIVRTEESRKAPLYSPVEPKYEVRQIRLPYIPDAESELRRRVAALIRDIRKRAAQKRAEAIAAERRRRKRKKEEAEVLFLLYG